jgi:hypothetical protein
MNKLYRPEVSHSCFDLFDDVPIGAHAITVNAAHNIPAITSHSKLLKEYISSQR